MQGRSQEAKPGFGSEHEWPQQLVTLENKRLRADISASSRRMRVVARVRVRVRVRVGAAPP